ncbi:NIF3-like protein 1 [Chironomus tepperi]|uniref:NIF3-like protein 1 n=1 Tax=Chironomus tepperi TaxID=113505 RepID=UPI00391F706D
MFRLTSLILRTTPHSNLIKTNLARNFSLSAIKETNMKLSEIVGKLESFGSLNYAEKWDNVGLLVEPTQVEVKKIMLTNDLTEQVMDEAIDKKTNMIISYHPPIFQGLKRLTSGHWKERIIIKAVENRIAIYSPHTVWDSISDGTSEWLANSIPNKFMRPVIPNITKNEFGAGRICQVDGSYSLRDIIILVKQHTEVSDLRVGVSFMGSLDSKIKSFACCPGSGASVLKEVKEDIDLFITGEMTHHEILEANSKNVHIIMLNHSKSERGYLHHFIPILANLLNPHPIEIFVSEKDEDPLKTY